MTTTRAIFVGVTPGLEPMLEAECRQLLPNTRVKILKGGIEVRVDDTELWQMAHQLRTAESLRVRMGQFEARDFKTLRKALQKLPWAAYLPRNATVEVHATARKSRLYHTGAVEEHASEAIAQRLAGGAGPQPEGPAGQVYLRLTRDKVQVSLDAIGHLLHKRGYRQHVVKAPLRETLAATCVRAAIESGTDLPMWDPFCGSGTLVIERQCMALQKPALTDTHLAFTMWPSHDAAAYEAIVSNLASTDPAAENGVSFGSDIDARELLAAAHNAKLAEVDHSVEWHTGDFEEVAKQLTSPMMVVSNLPYGHRTRGGKKLQATMRRFGALLRSREDLNPVVVLADPKAVPRAAGLRWRELSRFKNRGLPVVLLSLER